MATIWKQGATDFFVIGTNRDTLGVVDWEVRLVNLSTGVVTDETANVTVAEVEHVIATPATSLVVGATTAGAKTITVTATEGVNFSRGMKILIGTEYASIKAVTGDVITLSAPLQNNIANGVSVTQSGKTGDYRVVVPTASLTGTFVAGGSYQFQVYSDVAGIDITSEVVDCSDFSIQDDLKSEFDYLRSVVDGLAGGGTTTAKLFM